MSFSAKNPLLYIAQYLKAAFTGEKEVSNMTSTEIQEKV